MKKRGRPKETKRERLHVMVLPKTKRAIRRRISRSDKARNTAGKVVDKLVEENP